MPQHPASKPSQPRGAIDYPISAHDLIGFGRSPLRWVSAKPETEAAKPRASDLVRAMALAFPWLEGHYVRRPATFQYTYLECPKCQSTGSARVCRTCGRARVQRAEERPWSGASKYCVAWAVDMASRGLAAVPASDWDDADSMAKALQADRNIQELLTQSDVLKHYTGVWHDPATNLDIPIYGTVEIEPREGGTLDLALGSLRVSSDVSPYHWAAACYNSGQHIVAALAHGLHAVANGGARANHIWALVEGKEPFIIGRRRADAELLGKGVEILDALLTAYASCLKRGVWPPFDAAEPGSINAWTPVYLEPWMTQGDGTTGNYFALNGLPAEDKAP